MPRSDAHREADKRYRQSKRIGRLVVDFVEGEEELLEKLEQIKAEHPTGKSGWVKDQIKGHNK